MHRHPHVLGEHLETVAAGALRGVHRRVRGQHHVVGVLRAVLGGHPDADRDRQRVAGHVQRLAHRGQDLLDLVAAEPGQQRAGRHHAGQPGGQRAQHVVPGRVTGAVVDRLEPVHVEVDDADRGTALQHLGQVALERLAGQQPGQRVVPHLTAQLLLVVADARHVQAVRVDEPQGALRVVERRAVHLDPDQRPIVGTAVLARQRERIVGRRHLGEQAALLVDGDERHIPYGEIGGKLFRQPQPVAVGGVGAQHAPVRSEHRRRHGRLVERHAELGLALLQVVGGARLLGLGQAPLDHLEAGREQHRETVQPGPDQRVRLRRVVVVGVRAGQHAEQPVVDRGGEQERPERRPVPVERERGDRDEEREVRLGQAVAQRHEAGARDGEAERDRDRAQPAALQQGPGDHAGQHQQVGPEQGGTLVRAYGAEHGHHEHDDAEQHRQQAVPRRPVLVAQAATGRQTIPQPHQPDPHVGDHRNLPRRAEGPDGCRSGAEYV